MNIVKAQLTSLAAPFGSTDTSLVLTKLVDSKGVAIPFSAFNSTFVVIVLKSGTITEMVKLSTFVQNADGTVTCTVASSGRDLDPTSPYAGYSIGQDLPAGADALLTNDPLTMSRFVQLDNTNAFTVTPTTTAGNPTLPNEFVRKAYVDALVLGSLSTLNVIVPGTAGATVAAGNLVYFDTATGRWKFATAATTATVDNVLLGIAQGAGTNGTAIVSGVLLAGVDTNQSGMTGGNAMYASDTPGAIASSTGTEPVAVGLAKDATSLYFSPRFNMQLTKAGNDFIAAVTGMVFMYASASAPSGFLPCDGSAVSRTTYANLFAVIGTGYGVGDGSTTFNLPDLRGRTPIGKGTGTKIATFVSRASNVITVSGLTNAANNGFQTGQLVHYSAPSGAMTGLTDNTDYYLIRLSNTTFSLATTLANAQAGTAISLSSDGTGVQTFTLTLTARTVGDTGGEETHAMSATELLAHVHVENYTNASSGSVGPTGPGTLGNGSTTGLSTASTGGNAAMNNMQPFGVVNYIIKI